MSRKVTVTISAGDANNPRAILEEVLKALREKQVEVTIAVEPPVAGPTREEAFEQLRSGQALELDDAFAQIAGVSKDEWAVRVAAHRPPPRPGGETCPTAPSSFPPRSGRSGPSAGSQLTVCESARGRTLVE